MLGEAWQRMRGGGRGQEGVEEEMRGKTFYSEPMRKTKLHNYKELYIIYVKS